LQTVFSNNPLSGLLIIATLAVIAPGTLALSAAAAALGLLVSMVRSSIISRDVRGAFLAALPKRAFLFLSESRLARHSC